MKQLIVTLALVLLGLFIFDTAIMGDGATTLKSGAENITNTTVTKVKDKFK